MKTPENNQSLGAAAKRRLQEIRAGWTQAERISRRLLANRRFDQLARVAVESLSNR